jgi:hypothetical protein
MSDKPTSGVNEILFVCVVFFFSWTAYLNQLVIVLEFSKGQK